MLVTHFVNFRQLNDHLSGKELFMRFTTRAFHKLLSIYVFSYFPFGSEGRMWDLNVSVPDHCLSFYFKNKLKGTHVKTVRNLQQPLFPLTVPCNLDQNSFYLFFKKTLCP